ncbi:MAG TPA: hypothetical protein VGX91_14345 [Candidatus Cybelea sp.]|jgi:plastocyanin|nr:hypothetical protein [Candidatus Cybelea sp.]
MRKILALSIAVAAIALAACGGRYGSTNGGTNVIPGTLAYTAHLPDGRVVTGTMGEELPSEGVGRIADSYWSATLGGFTQSKYSQALGFPPKTVITLTNLSANISHTLDFVAKIKGPPANFPTNPNLPISAAGGGKFKKGYASGAISPGKSVTLTLVKPGIYLIGCAFHYSEGMQDVLVVKKNATPGPEATPPA